MLAYLARYTHRVAISNSRLIALDDKGVTFKWKDYRIKGRDRLKTMTLDAAEFIRRFLLHVLPSGFHRIRHYGLFAGTVRARNIERVRQLLAAPEASPERSRAEADSEAETASPARRCPCCGGRMIIVETFEGRAPCALPIADPDQDRHLMTDRRASRLATPLSLASSRAPEQERDVLTTSADPLQPPRPSPPHVSAPAKKPVVSLPTITPAAFQPPPPHRRSVRDPQIPIGRAHQTAPFLPAVSSLRGFRTPAPRLSPDRPAKGRRPKPFSRAADGNCDRERRKLAGNQALPVGAVSARSGPSFSGSREFSVFGLSGIDAKADLIRRRGMIVPGLEDGQPLSAQVARRRRPCRLVQSQGPCGARQHAGADRFRGPQHGKNTLDQRPSSRHDAAALTTATQLPMIIQGVKFNDRCEVIAKSDCVQTQTAA